MLFLTSDQKQQRVNVCEGLRQIASNNTTFMFRVIAGDPETNQQSSQMKSPNSPRPKKVRQVKSNVKSMLIIFFDIKKIVYKKFVLTGKTVSSAYCCDILWRLHENVLRLHCEL
jgi:hypothetical protein